MKILAIMAGETKKLLAGRFPLVVILVGLPLGFTLLFGWVYEKNVVNHVPLAICDQDQTSLSRSLVRMYEDSQRYSVVVYAASPEEMRREILYGHAKAGLLIPTDFSHDVKAGKGTSVLLTVDSANNMFGNAALAASQEIGRAFSLAVAQKLLEGAGNLPAEALAAAYPLRMSVRVIGNPTGGYSPFMLSGLLLNGLQIGLLIVFSPLFFDELAKGCLEKRRELILRLVGRAIPYWLMGMTGFGVSLAAAHFCCALPFRGSLWEAVMLGGAFLFFVMGALSVFSACAPIRIMTIQMPMLYIMPGLLYSGLSWPSFAMNEAAYGFSLLLPMSYAGDSLRDIMLLGYTPHLTENCLRMLLYGCFGFLASALILMLRLRRLPRKERVPDDTQATSGL